MNDTTSHKAWMAFGMSLLALVLARFGFGEAPSAQDLGQLLIDAVAALLGSAVVAWTVWKQRNYPK